MNRTVFAVQAVETGQALAVEPDDVIVVHAGNAVGVVLTRIGRAGIHADDFCCDGDLLHLSDERGGYTRTLQSSRACAVREASQRSEKQIYVTHKKQRSRNGSLRAHLQMGESGRSTRSSCQSSRKSNPGGSSGWKKSRTNCRATSTASPPR